MNLGTGMTYLLKVGQLFRAQIRTDGDKRPGDDTSIITCMQGGTRQTISFVHVEARYAHTKQQARYAGAEHEHPHEPCRALLAFRDDGEF